MKKYFLVIPIIFLAWNAYSDEITNAPIDLVSFFKQAISSPPDIEKYVAKRTNLLRPMPGSAYSSSNGSSSFQYYEGALSGTNFYLRYLPDPNQPTGINQLGTISARAGSSTYELAGHGIVYGVGKNGLTEEVQVQFSLSRQILCMGAGELEPGTIKWNGSEFTAKNIFGKDVHGSLQISNDLPFRAEFNLSNELNPYKAIVYTYPSPADHFSGYPAHFLISYNNTEGLTPMAEIEFKSVQVATQQLSAAFFNESRFAIDVEFTNVFSNSDFYASKTKSKELVKLNSYLESGGLTNSNSRKIMYICFIFVTLFSVAILLIWSVRKTKKQN